MQVVDAHGLLQTRTSGTVQTWLEPPEHTPCQTGRPGGSKANHTLEYRTHTLTVRAVSLDSFIFHPMLLQWAISLVTDGTRGSAAAATAAWGPSSV